MGPPAIGTLSLGEPKGRSFTAALRQAIRATYGTNREFAKALGVSEGRVSQLIIANESLTAQSLDQVLSCFENLGVQESLHGAWVNTFAPPPLEQLAALDAEIEAERLFNGRSELLAAGRARKVLTQLRSILTHPIDDNLRFRVLLEAIALALFLQRPSLAFSLSRRMIERAQELGETGWIATGLYTIANASRTVESIGSQELIRCHEEALQFVTAWSDRTSPTRVQLKDALVRDRVLTLLVLQERRRLDVRELVSVQRSLDEAIARTEISAVRAHALEVKVRLLTECGRHFEAEEVLDVAASATLTHGDYPTKTRVAGARILLARNENDEARAVLEQALEDCYAIDNLHHASVIERLLVRIDPGTNA